MVSDIIANFAVSIKKIGIGNAEFTLVENPTVYWNVSMLTETRLNEVAKTSIFRLVTH